MRLGIDIDDVITDSSELINKYAKKYFKSNDINLINKILHGIDQDSKLVNFYQNYLTEMQSKYNLKDNVKEVIDRLRRKGHTIILITARGNTDVYKELGNLGQDKVTKKYLEKHQIAYDDIIFKIKDKKETCIENEIDVIIDDSVRVLEEFKGTDIKPLLFTSISNKHFKTEFDRVSNWLELEEYIDSNYS